MTAVAHDHQGDKPEGTPRSHLLAAIPPYSQLTGDEVSALPYEYKVG